MMMVPKDFPQSPQINIVEDISDNEIEEKDEEITIPTAEKPKTYTLEEVRKEHKEAYKPWTPELDDELTIMYCEGIYVKDMAKHFGRTKGAIYSRIKKLELEELYG